MARQSLPLRSGQSLNVSEKTRRTLAVVLFLVIAATAWMMLQQAQRSVSGASHENLIFNPGYQHAQRLKVAAARAAMDVLGMAGADKQDPDAIETYRTDYRLQTLQMQADSEGLERWGAKDHRRQGLLLEIRASLVELKAALDQTAGTSPGTGALGKVPLFPALNRAESAFSNYAASLTQPSQPQTTHYLLAAPVLLWWLLILLLIETAILTWLAASARSRSIAQSSIYVRCLCARTNGFRRSQLYSPRDFSSDRQRAMKLLSANEAR